MTRPARSRCSRALAHGSIAGACALAVLATTPAPRASKAQPDGGTPPPVPPVGPRGPEHAREYAVLEPAFVDRRARVAIRCLGVKPHPHRPRSVARFWIEAHNTTDEEIELVEDSVYVDWAKEHRAPEWGIATRLVAGETEVAPGEASRVRVAFIVDAGDPDEVHVLRLRGVLRSDAGAQFLLQPVFERARPGAPAPFHFVPGRDPFQGLGVPPQWR